MTLHEALKITGGLSYPSKMPCPCWGISQRHCITGAKQAKKFGTVCSKCYAARGHYLFPDPQRAMQRRLDGLKDFRWVDAMVFLIGAYADKHFRWFDSGDLQSVSHFDRIIDVAKALPSIDFWLPTQEQLMVMGRRPPKNLTVRVTAPKINATKMPAFRNVAVVIEAGKDTWPRMIETNNKQRWYCPADGAKPHKCRTCRACWDKSIEQIVYRKK